MDKGYYQKYEPVFGVWKIKKLLGEGSFGKVFELEREDFGVVYKAALKVITIPQNDSEILDARAEGMDEQSIRSHFSAFARELVQEFELMSHFKGNSNVVSYENHQVIPHADGVGWDILIQMELLTPLNRYTTEHTVTRQDVIRLGVDLCRALELCQKYNVIHRDVKPENIFVSENGDFKLGDFGIARTVEKTTSGLSKKGTYTYMAPEVYKGEAYGSSVDIYSLGIVMYRLLNGNRTPFLPSPPAYISPADRESALLKRMGGAPLPKPIHAEGRLAEIVLKACAYEAKERYSSPAQMRQELEAILYTQEEQKYIYPEGDDVPQDSYVKTEDAPPSGADDKTVSAFDSVLGDKTVSAFGHASGDKTASVLDVKRDSTLSAFDSVTEDKTVSVFDRMPQDEKQQIDGVHAESNKSLFKAALPLIIGMLAQGAAHILTLIFSSWYGGYRTASRFAAAPLESLVTGIAFSVSFGVLILLSRRLGAGDRKGGARVAGNAIALTLILSLALLSYSFCCGPACALVPELAGLVGNASGEIVVHGIIYVEPVCMFAFAALFQALFESFLIASGKCRLAMISMLTNAVLNVLLSNLLMFHTDLSHAGASYAAVIAHAVAAVVALALNLHYNKEIRICKADLKIDRSVFAQLLKSVFPMLFAQLALPVAYFALAWLAPSFHATLLACTAATGAAAVILQPAMAVNMMGVSRISADLGAGRKDRVEQTVKKGITIGLIVAACMTLCSILMLMPNAFPFLGGGNELGFARLVAFCLGILAIVQMLTVYLQATNHGTKTALLAVMQIVELVGWFAVNQ